jgi:hypothetical protein
MGCATGYVAHVCAQEEGHARVHEAVSAPLIRLRLQQQAPAQCGEAEGDGAADAAASEPEQQPQPPHPFIVLQHGPRALTTVTT